MKEVWKNAVGYEFYKISSLGRMKSPGTLCSDGRNYPSRISKPRSRFVQLKDNGVYVHVNFARLVLKTFKGLPPKGKNLATHKDDNVANNHLGNLRWGSKRSNALDAIRNGKHFISSKQRKQISKTLTGHSVSEETREKIRRGVARYYQRKARRAK